MDTKNSHDKPMEYPLNLIEAINQLNFMRANVAHGLDNAKLHDNKTFGEKFHSEIQMTMISLLKQIQNSENTK